MMNMGNGATTGARCYQHIRRLMDLHTNLSGLQQMGLGPQPAPSQEITQAWDEYAIELHAFLQDIKNDLSKV